MIECKDECDNQPFDWTVGSTSQLSMKTGATNIVMYYALQAIATNNCNNSHEKGTYTYNHLASDCGCILGLRQ